MALTGLRGVWLRTVALFGLTTGVVPGQQRQPGLHQPLPAGEPAAQAPVDPQPLPRAAELHPTAEVHPETEENESLPGATQPAERTYPRRQQQPAPAAAADGREPGRGAPTSSGGGGPDFSVKPIPYEQTQEKAA